MSAIQLLEKLGANAMFSTSDITVQDKEQLVQLVDSQSNFNAIQAQTCSEE